MKIRRLLLVCLLSLLTACRTAQLTKLGPDPDAEEKLRGGQGMAPEPSPTGRRLSVIRLFYATDRRPHAAAGTALYGSGRNPELQFGTCLVSIPYVHESGVLETQRWTHLEFAPDTNAHVVLLAVRPTTPQAFTEDLRTRVAATPIKSVLVFIHGYNVTFSTAARRTAQIVYDIDFPGIAIVYSWPSHGTLKDYLGDEGNAQWTAPHLRSFLEQIVEQSGARSIHVIAHSMGNRPLVDSLERLSVSQRQLFDTIVLTAPDVDAGILSNIAARVRSTARNVTLYASSRDKALHASRIAHTRQPRAGEAGKHLLVLDGIDTVDASDVETDFFALGHSYTGDSTLALTDLRKLLLERKPPDLRGLKRLLLATKPYWRLVLP